MLSQGEGERSTLGDSMKVKTNMLVTKETEKVLVESLEPIESVALEFFKLRFPFKVEGIKVHRDFGYFDEWIARFTKNTAWIYADYESRLAIIQLEKMGLVKLWTRD